MDLGHLWQVQSKDHVWFMGSCSIKLFIKCEYFLFLEYWTKTFQKDWYSVNSLNFNLMSLKMKLPSGNFIKSKFLQFCNQNNIPHHWRWANTMERSFRIYGEWFVHKMCILFDIFAKKRDLGFSAPIWPENDLHWPL